MRPPLSNAEEESIFQRMDDACDACAHGLKAHILRRWEKAGAGLHQSTLALALAYGAPSAVNIAAKNIRPLASRAMKFTKPKAVAKAGTPKLTDNEAAAIEDALEAGIQFGLEALPANIRSRVDVEEATALARRRLSRGIFRQHLAEFDESLRGLERIVDASRDPALAVLKDPIQLSQMFGLNAQQAAIIVRETQSTIAYLRKPPIRGVERPLTKEDIETVRRVMRRRVRQAVEARAELQGQTLAQEAIATAQQALYDTAKRQGLLDADKHFKEWVTRRDEKVCPRCDAFDHKRVPVDEMFVSDTGEKAYQPGIHPRCRCRTRLVTQRTAARPRRSQNRAA